MWIDGVKSAMSDRSIGFQEAKKGPEEVCETLLEFIHTFLSLTLLRVWDCFMLEGPKVLFRFSLAILKMNEKAILAKHDTVSIMRQLKAAAKLCFDVDSLFKTAFEDLKPFTRRQDISSKQAYYYKTIKEHAKKMEMEKVALKDREKMLSEMEILGTNQLVIECAAVYDKDKVWLCHGHQNGAQITKVNCEENIMYRLNIEFESRVMCMHCLDDDTMLLGTLSHFVHAYSTRSRRLIWETRLNDSILALSSHEEDGTKQVYAGLADGTVAVIENIQGPVPKPETFYIMIGSSPVTCIRLVDRRLWCGSGNRVVILSARTLDAVDQFQTSSSVLDYISMLVPDEFGVWVTIRGSSILQLWDSQTLTCKLLYDVKDNRYPRSPKSQDEETNVNQARITAVLPFGGSVLVGTAEGSLIIYDIITRLSRSASSADFHCRRQVESANVDHIQERIQELLLEQKKADLVEEKHFPELNKGTDSGCYTTPSRTPCLIFSHRDSTQVPDSLPLSLDQEDSADISPEEPSEATSGSTVRRAGTDPSITSPESQFCGDVGDKSHNDVTRTTSEETTDSMLTLTAEESSARESTKLTDTDRDDSGRSSISTQSKVNEEHEVFSGCSSKPKKLCTCHQLTSRTVKCSHCLLETSEALRNLFNKYSLSTTPGNCMDTTTRYQNLINDNKSKNLLWKNQGDDVKEDQESQGDKGKDIEKIEISTSSSDISENSEASNHKNNNKSDEEDIEINPVNVSDSCLKMKNTNADFINSLSVLEKHKKIRSKNSSSSLLRAISADDVTRWVKSQENFSSSVTSDSYDFDDLFIAYTEDESTASARTPKTNVKSQMVYRSKETEALLESIRERSLAKRRSSNVCDYTPSCASSVVSQRTDYGSSNWYGLKSRSTSPWIDTSAASVSSCSLGRYNVNHNTLLSARLRLLDVRTQLPPWGTSFVADGEICSGAKDKISAPISTSPTNWLSYEESVTENDSLPAKTPTVLNKDLLQLGEWSSGTHKGSDTASNVSFNSTEISYSFELSLQEKIKISDKPIKCLLDTRKEMWTSEKNEDNNTESGNQNNPKEQQLKNKQILCISSLTMKYGILSDHQNVFSYNKEVSRQKKWCSGEPTIISCAGCYGDDEAVLKWTRLGDEKLWTNDPVIEVCPYTNAIKPSPYVRSRLPCRTSSLASMNPDSDSTARASRSSVTSTSSSATSVVGSGLAKVQNMFLRVQEKV